MKELCRVCECYIAAKVQNANYSKEFELLSKEKIEKKLTYHNKLLNTKVESDDLHTSQKITELSFMKTQSAREVEQAVDAIAHLQVGVLAHLERKAQNRADQQTGVLKHYEGESPLMKSTIDKANTAKGSDAEKQRQFETMAEWLRNLITNTKETALKLSTEEAERVITKYARRQAKADEIKIKKAAEPKPEKPKSREQLSLEESAEDKKREALQRDLLALSKSL